MLVSAVVKPSLFDADFLSDSGALKDARSLLASFLVNGLLLVDSERRLLRKMAENILALPEKQRQKLWVLIEDIMKTGRFVQVSQLTDSISETTGLEDTDRLAVDLWGYSQGDSLVSRPPCDEQRGMDQFLSSLGVVEIGEYEQSLYAEKCQDYLTPPILSAPDEDWLRDALIRVLRFSRSLAFYDRYLSKKAEDPEGWRAGLYWILDLWRKHCRYSEAERDLRIDVYTGFVRGDARRKLRISFADLLEKEFGVNIRLHSKSWEGKHSRHRYLRTDRCLLNFTEGFDLFYYDRHAREYRLRENSVYLVRREQWHEVLYAIENADDVL